MVGRKTITLNLLCICCILLTFLVSGCGEDYSSSHDENDLSNTGSYACSIKWPEDVPTLESKSALPREIDCDAAGIATVAFAFYDGSGSYLTGDEWSCSLHEGTVYGIPAGTNRRLVVTGKDSSGTVLYRGEETGITITAGQITQGGEIEMEYVYGIVPSIPTNVTATAGNEEVTISWDSVTGATSYNIYWSTEQGVTADTGTKITTFSSPYTHTGLTNGTTYYYVVTAENSYGESDESSEVSASPNSRPIATITSPSDGSTFTEGDTITFSGTGEDAEDGTLTGSSLVWTSSINGQIDTGTSFSISSLSVGEHTITLTVTDSDNETGNDSITITVNTLSITIPTASITSPTDSSIFTEGDTVTFSGTGEDAEDGTLTGSSLVWTSSINVQIGTGTSFSISSLSVGEHTITLTVTDTDGDSDSDTVTVTVEDDTPDPAGSTWDEMFWDEGKWG